MDHDGPAVSRRKRWLVAGFVALELLFVLATLDREPYDDSFFFKRIALNALDHGVLAWNVADGPVYGSTSQLFQVVVLGLTALTREHTFLAQRFVAVACLAVAYALLLAGSGRTERGLAATVALASPVALYTLLSGMETALVLALVAGSLRVTLAAPTAESPELARPAPPPKRWLLAPCLVWLVWLARPDAILLVLPALVVEHWAARARLPLRELAALVAAILACLALFKLYYGTALPLPFYAKTRALSPYDAHFLALSDAIRSLRFGIFLAVALPLGLFAALRRDRTNLTLLGSALAFVAYHWFFTIEVMGMQGRFYAPALPVLAVAAARAGSASPPKRTVALRLMAVYAAVVVLLTLFHGLPRATDWRLDQVPLAVLAVPVLGGLALIFAPRSPGFERWCTPGLLGAAALGTLFGQRFEQPKLRSDDEYLDLYASTVTVYRGLDTLRACFGDSVHLYHSEIGLPGLRFLPGTVTDLAGLMDPRWLFGHETFDSACRADRPEAIFLPHRNYAALNAQILASDCLRGYERVVETSSSPLYVRRDLAGRYRRCETETRASERAVTSQVVRQPSVTYSLWRAPSSSFK